MRLLAASLESGMHNAMPCPASTSMRIEPKVSHSDAWFDAGGSENAVEVFAIILATEAEEWFAS